MVFHGECIMISTRFQRFISTWAQMKWHLYLPLCVSSEKTTKWHLHCIMKSEDQPFNWKLSLLNSNCKHWETVCDLNIKHHVFCQWILDPIWLVDVSGATPNNHWCNFDSHQPVDRDGDELSLTQDCGHASRQLYQLYLETKAPGRNIQISKRDSLNRYLPLW